MTTNFVTSMMMQKVAGLEDHMDQSTLSIVEMERRLWTEGILTSQKKEENPDADLQAFREQMNMFSPSTRCDGKEMVSKWTTEESLSLALKSLALSLEQVIFIAKKNERKSHDCGKQKVPFVPVSSSSGGRAPSLSASSCSASSSSEQEPVMEVADRHHQDQPKEVIVSSTVDKLNTTATTVSCSSSIFHDFVASPEGHSVDLSSKLQKAMRKLEVENQDLKRQLLDQQKALAKWRRLAVIKRAMKPGNQAKDSQKDQPQENVNEEWKTKYNNLKAEHETMLKETHGRIQSLFDENIALHEANQELQKDLLEEMQQLEDMKLSVEESQKDPKAKDEDNIFNEDSLTQFGNLLTPDHHHDPQASFVRLENECLELLKLTKQEKRFSDDDNGGFNDESLRYFMEELGRLRKTARKQQAGHDDSQQSVTSQPKGAEDSSLVEDLNIENQILLSLYKDQQATIARMEDECLELLKLTKEESTSSFETDDFDDEKLQTFMEELRRLRKTAEQQHANLRNGSQLSVKNQPQTKVVQDAQHTKLVEQLTAERDSLQLECKRLQEKVVQDTQQQTAILDTQVLEQLATERDTLQRQCQRLQEIKASNDFALERLMKERDGLTTERDTLQRQCQRLQEIKASNDFALESLMKERDGLRRQCLLSEQVMMQVEEDRTQVKQSIEERSMDKLQDERDMWQSKCKSKQESIKIMKDEFEDLAKQMGDLQDSNERLHAKCVSQQVQISQLEDELERRKAKSMQFDSKRHLLDRVQSYRSIGDNSSHHNRKLDNHSSHTNDKSQSNETSAAEAAVASLMAKVESLEELIQEGETKRQTQADTIAKLSMRLAETPMTSAPTTTVKDVGVSSTQEQ